MYIHLSSRGNFGIQRRSCLHLLYAVQEGLACRHITCINHSSYINGLAHGCRMSLTNALKIFQSLCTPVLVLTMKSPSSSVLQWKLVAHFLFMAVQSFSQWEKMLHMQHLLSLVETLLSHRLFISLHKSLTRGTCWLFVFREGLWVH